jgi:RNA polymerase sigma-70 factor (ECF subfamily)
MGLSFVGISLFAGRDELIASPTLRIFASRQEAREEHGHLGQRREIVELYDRLRPSLYQYLVCLGLRPEEADDVIQDAFLRFFYFQDGGGEVENPRSWLFRVAHNASLDLKRRERRLISESDEDTSRTAFERRAPATPTPEELLLQKEQLVRLDAAMAQLTAHQRQCVHLRAEGLRYREIADVLGTTVWNVNQTLRRAMVRLVEKLL